MTNAPKRTGWRRLPLRLILAVLVTLFLAVVFAGSPWQDVINALLKANPYWLAAAVVSNLLIYPPWVLQWQLLAKPSADLPARRMFGIVALSSMGTAAMSSVVGTTSAVLLLVGRGGMKTVAAVSLMVMDQILVGLGKLTVLAIALNLAALPVIAAQGGFAMAALTLGGLILLILLAHYRPHISATETSSRIRKWLSANLDRLAESVDAMRQPRLVFVTYLLAVAKRFTNVGAAFAVAMACGVEATPALAVLVVAGVGLTTALPIVPGSYGIYSATVFAVYTFLGFPAHIALAAGILQHLVELVPALVVGYSTVVASRFHARRNGS